MDLMKILVYIHNGMETIQFRLSVLVLLISETEHLSVNNTVRRASTLSRSTPFYRVVTGSLHKSF